MSDVYFFTMKEKKLISPFFILIMASLSDNIVLKLSHEIRKSATAWKTECWQINFR